MILRALCLVAVIAGSPGLFAQTFPQKQIKLVTAGAPGSVPDTIVRPLAEKMSERLGQPVVIENRPGAGGIIAMSVVAKAKPDGYTIALVSRAQMVYNSYLFEKLSYDPLRDFAPVINLVAGPGAVVVHPSVPADSLDEFIAFARRQHEIHYAIPQVGSPPHVLALRFSAAAQIEMGAVAYRGSSEALAAVLAGEVPVAFDSLAVVAPHVNAGKLKVLAVTGRERSRALPEAPTLGECGFADFATEDWLGLVVPTGVAPAIIARLNEAADAALRVPAVKERYEQTGLRVLSGSAEEFAVTIKNDHDSWGPIIRKSGVRLDQ
jgi:tripartite-type tricarboxylate transporter receptor subunit TctC